MYSVQENKKLSACINNDQIVTVLPKLKDTENILLGEYKA